MKYFLLSAAVTLLFIIQSFHIEGFGAVNDVPQDLDYGIKFHYPDTWKYLPKYNIDTTADDDLSTTSFTIIHNSSIINDIDKSFNGYLITIKVIDDIPLPTITAKQWARTALTDISEQPNKYKLIEPATPNGEFKTLPISQGKYNGYTFTIEDKTTKKIKVKTVLVLDNKRYEFDYTSSNINNEIAYTYINDYKEILNSVKFY
ncbi:MAG: hypothetical protein MUO21_07900 [Nitrososphaeraceae archaeon]|nr:hypothetical protein [Nitrososphaeraceae archaeon]